MRRDDVAVREPGHVSRARVLAATAARSAGLPERVVDLVELGATELASNLLKYGVDGLLAVQAGPGHLDVLAIDRGPGIGRVADSLRDGYSTGGSLGTGLGAVRRAADTFDVYSAPGRGTAVLARWGRNRTLDERLRLGSVVFTAPGETACGDRWTTVQRDHLVTVVVCDGLGHGPAAASAAELAVAEATSHAGSRPTYLLRAMHQRLAGTRGATVGVAQLDLNASVMRFAGIGNVAARLYPRTGDTPVRLVSTPGIVGSAGSVANVMETVRPWSERCWLVMHTDGVTERWNARDWGGIFRHDPALVAAWVLGQHARWRDDACVLAVAGNQAAVGNRAL